MHKFSPSDCPTYRFKERTNHDQGGLEFTLAATIPPLPPSIIFGEIDDKCSTTQMIRCITAHQLWNNYHIVSPPGTGRVSTIHGLVAPRHFPRRFLIGLPDYVFVVSGKLTHSSRGKRYPLLSSRRHLPRKILRPTLAVADSCHILPTNENLYPRPVDIHTRNTHIHPGSTLHHAQLVVHTHGHRPLHRTIWEDRRAIFGYLTSKPIDDHKEDTGKWLITTENPTKPCTADYLL